MTDSGTPTSRPFLDKLREITNNNRELILESIEEHLSKIDWDYYVNKVKTGLENCARKGMDVGKSIVDAPQEFNLVDYYWQCEHWNARDTYRESFRDRLLPKLIDLGLPTITTDIQDGVNEYRFQIIVEAKW